MTDPGWLDESRLVWVAALVQGVDPAESLSRVDVAVLVDIVAEADTVTEPVDAAAVLLVRIVRDRPFDGSNAAIGWLAAVELLAATHRRLAAPPADVVGLCESIRAGAAGSAGVAAVLRRWVDGDGDGMACPVCGRRVYVLDAAARRFVMPGTARFELTARCAFEHGSHDRSGRPTTAPAARRGEPRQPVLARGVCGSFLVAGDAGAVVVSPFCDDPPIARVVEVGDVRPSDLVGRWDPLVGRSTTLGFVPADDVLPDESGCVDLDRLHRALRTASRRRAAVAAAAVRESPSPVAVS
jgi:hypothetical protein